MHERTTVRKKTGLRTQMMTLMLILCTLALLIQGCLLIYASVRFYSEKAYDDMEFFLQTCNSNFSSKMLYVEGVVNNLQRRYKETNSDWMRDDAVIFLRRGVQLGGDPQPV